MGLASSYKEVRWLCKGIWLSEGIPSACSGEGGLLGGPWAAGSSRVLRERGNRDPGFAKVLPGHWRGGRLSSVTESVGEGRQLTSLTAPASRLRFPVSIS